MKRVLIFLVLVISATLLFAGGAQEKAVGEETGPVTVKISTWMSIQEASRDMMAEIEKKFEQKYPDVDLEYVGVPFEQIQQQTLVAISGGNPTDIIHLTPKWPFQLAPMGALEDLTPWFKDDLNDIPKAALETGMMDGKLISVPLQLGTIVVLGMKSNLSAVGFPEKIPETWAEFKDAVRKITNISDRHYGFAARTAKHPNSAFWFFPVMYGHSGEFEDAQGNIVFDGEGTLAALDWYREIGLTKQTPLGMAIPESRNLFAQGKVGFIFDGPWMKKIMRMQSGKGEGIDPLYTAAPFPKGPDGTTRGINNNHVLVLTKQSKVKDQAVAFIKFWSQDPEITDLHYDVMGAIPPYKSLQRRATYSNLHDLAKAVIAGSAYSEGSPSKNPYFPSALEFIAAAIQEALLGGDPDKIAKKTADSIRTLYGQ